MKKLLSCLLVFWSFGLLVANAAETETATADSFEPADSVFQQIALLEQDKILMQLEKEKSQLELDLDRIAAERVRLQLEIDALAGNIDSEMEALEQERQRLAAEKERLDQERKAAQTGSASAALSDEGKKTGAAVSGYRLLEIIGAGNQLQAMVENLETHQRRPVFVGSELDGAIVRSVSFAEGVVLDNNGDISLIGMEGDGF
ncbi:MAG: hypothetical protein LBR41_03035 [Rickettsiales bacterium]|nr:hypothetical protein [Rickettsiales bacterium]